MAEVVVIGAGIVGLSAAYHLHADGHRVTVVDRDPDGDRASSGNAGGIGISEIVPASVPGLIWRVPGWLLDPLGPLSVRLADTCPPCCPGCGASCASGTPAEVERITSALAALASRLLRRSRPVAGDAWAVGRPAPGRCTLGLRDDRRVSSRSAGMGSQAPTRHPRRGDHRRRRRASASRRSGRS